MTIATLAIAVLGVLLSALSLGWQAATFVLTGGRVRAELRAGGIDPGGGMVTGPAKDMSLRQANELKAQGFTRPVVAVQVRNVGRLPVVITGWSLVTEPGGVGFHPMADSIGPPLDHRLEAGAPAIWAVDGGAAQRLVRVTAEALNVPPDRIRLRGRVSLGTGRNVDTRETL